jgi:hypothetical protein
MLIWRSTTARIDNPRVKIDGGRLSKRSLVKVARGDIGADVAP